MILGALLQDVKGFEDFVILTLSENLRTIDRCHESAPMLGQLCKLAGHLLLASNGDNSQCFFGLVVGESCVTPLLVMISLLQV